MMHEIQLQQPLGTNRIRDSRCSLFFVSMTKFRKRNKRYDYNKENACSALRN